MFDIIKLMDWQKQNNKVYNESAKKLAEYFAGIGPRIHDIDHALDLAGKKDNIRAVELGCGDGRDAMEIVKRVSWYEGIDPSVGLLDIARKKLPDTSFVLSDALQYDYPNNLDIIFAFASLLHCNQDDLYKVFEKAATALRIDGIFYISLKERPVYTEEIKKDEFGERMFYYYNPEIVQNIAGDNFECEFIDKQTIGHTDWFTIALKRK